MTEGNLYSPQRWSEKQRLNAEEQTAGENLFFTLMRQQGVSAEQLTLHLNELTEMFYAVETGIILFSRMGLACIEGRNLGGLHRQLAAKKVTEIRELSESSSVFFDPTALFLAGIQFESDNMRALQMA
jgi:hypothetical protein